MSPPSVDRSRVLLVDADHRTSQQLARLLTEDGFDVELARDGTTAVEALAQPRGIDVLVTELRLPRLDATSLVRFARARHPAVTVVVVTSFANLFSAERFGHPVPFMLPKPLDYDALLSLLRERAERRRESTSPASPTP
jgi:DNA-binding NtrC family response regulator